MNDRFARAAIAGSLWLASCNSVDQTTVLTSGDEVAHGSPPPNGLNEPLATIAASTVVSGFKHGRLRKEIEVPDFSISKQPITVGQYRSCMDANVCTKPVYVCTNVAETASDGAARDAALCVGEDNARAYCTWSAGRLPTLSEWLLAARGRSPQRFSWGDGNATCEQHPLAFEQMLQPAVANSSAAAGGPLGSAAVEVPSSQSGCAEPDAGRFEVGRHTAGASPFGVEDVLITKGELLGGERESHFSACAQSNRGCIVYGLMPGAIDAVRVADEAGGAAVSQPYTFRCVWSQEGS